MFESLKSLATVWTLFRSKEVVERNVLVDYLNCLDDSMVKKDFLNRLDQCAGDYYNQEKSPAAYRGARDELAEAIYNTVMSQASMVFTKMHSKEEEEFRALCAGIKAYATATGEEREALKNKVIKTEGGAVELLDVLARRLRVLKPEEKEKYLQGLDQLQKNYDTSGEANWKSLAISMYEAFNGKTVQDLEPEEIITRKDETEQEELDMICNGIRVYLRAQPVERSAFQTKVRKPATVGDMCCRYVERKRLAFGL